MNQPVTRHDPKDIASNSHYNPVDVRIEGHETVGTIMISFMLFIVLMALLRSNKRERKLASELTAVKVQLKQLSPPK